MHSKFEFETSTTYYTTEMHKHKVSLIFGKMYYIIHVLLSQKIIISIKQIASTLYRCNK